MKDPQTQGAPKVTLAVPESAPSGVPETPPAPGQVPEVSPVVPAVEPVTLVTEPPLVPITQKKLDELVKSETDKRVTQAVETTREAMRKEQAEAQKQKDKEAEAKRLRDAGEHEQLAKTLQGQLDVYKAQEARTQFRDSAQATLEKEGVSATLSTILLSPMHSQEEVATVGRRLQQGVEQAVVVEVNKRLTTAGITPPTPGVPPAEKSIGDMSPEEWKEYKKRKGVV